MMATNWKAMQVPEDKKAKKYPAARDAQIKRMSMGSWHANAAKGGAFKK